MSDRHSPPPPPSPTDPSSTMVSPPSSSSASAAGSVPPSRLSSPNASTTSGSMESVADSTITPSDYSKSSTFDAEWPQKTAIASSTTSGRTLTSIGDQRKPEGRVKVRTLCLLGALLPGIGCYLCIFYTYLFQLDRVMNFTSTNCEDVKSHFPPISYSIGVWKPQKYLWMIVLTLHLPPRLLYGLAYKGQYVHGQSKHKENDWFPTITRLHVRLLFIEALGLVLVSVIDIESSFGIHALCYAIWIIALDFNMLFNCILHHYSGIRNFTQTHNKTFYIKCGLFLVGYPLSVSTGFSYGIYVWQCSATAYALFSIAEYMIVGINSFFYFTLVWEMNGSQLEFHFRHDTKVITSGNTIAAV